MQIVWSRLQGHLYLANAEVSDYGPRDIYPVRTISREAYS